MARDHGRIRHRIWSDPDFLALREVDQRAFMLALSQPGLSYCGVVPFTLRRWQRLAADSTTTRLRRAIAALEQARYVVVDEDTEELLIRSFLRHDGILDSPNITRAAIKDFGDVHSPLLRAVILCECVRMQTGESRPGNDRSWNEVISPWLVATLPESFGETFTRTLTEAQLRNLQAVENETLDLAISSARAAPTPGPYPDPRRPSKPSPNGRCEVHHLDEPCRGCAADRKAAR